MTQPLTERLRSSKSGEVAASLAHRCHEAADRIEALEATQAELVDALERLRPLFVDMVRADEEESKWAEDWKPSGLQDASHNALKLLAKLEAGQ